MSNAPNLADRVLSRVTRSASTGLARRLSVALLVALALLGATPTASADEGSLEKAFTSITKSTTKSFLGELGKLSKEYIVEVNQIAKDLDAGEISADLAGIKAMNAYLELLASLFFLLDASEDGDSFFLGACLDELEQIPTGVQPGGCGIRDWKRITQDKALTKAVKRIGKGNKKLVKVGAKQQVQVNAIAFPIPQPRQVAVELEQGVTPAPVKPTDLLFLIAAHDPGTVTGGPETSTIGAVGLADPRNGATVDLRLLDADGDVVDEVLGVAIGLECQVSATFSGMGTGAFLVEMVHGGYRVSRAITVGA